MPSGRERKKWERACSRRGWICIAMSESVVSTGPTEEPSSDAPAVEGAREGAREAFLACFFF